MEMLLASLQPVFRSLVLRLMVFKATLNRLLQTSISFVEVIRARIGLGKGLRLLEGRQVLSVKVFRLVQHVKSLIWETKV
jgi:hypothetical protein